MPKVVFDIEGGKPVTAECNVGDNLLELARRANVAIDAPCSGNGSCGKCRVKLTAGEGGAEPMHLITDASGTFIYCHGGRAVSGTWTKGGVEQPFGFTLADGSPLRVAPGRTFVELPGLEANIACS